MDEQQNTDTNQHQTEMISAIYMGADGDEGYKNGEVYNLKKWEENDMIFVSREDGSGQVAYQSMEALENNFEIQPEESEEEAGDPASEQPTPEQGQT
jgi:hypothetical protein